MWINRESSAASYYFHVAATDFRAPNNSGMTMRPHAKPVFQLATAIAIFAGAAISAGTVTQADEVQEVVISAEALKIYKNEYLKTKRPGAFAVSADGYVIGYSYCPEYRCRLQPSARQLALNSCMQAGGKGCRIFAVGDDIKVKYRIIE